MSFCSFKKKQGVQLNPPNGMPSALDALFSYYIHKVQPIEEITNFNKITTPGYTYSELTGKPTILFLGPYSTGKTSMINYIINDTYKGSKIGPEPTTDNFTVLTYGKEPKIIDSNTIVCMEDYQFKQVESFGQTFLNKFEQVEVPSEILKSMNIIDTPGIYENTDEEGTGIGYPYNKVLRYFCQRVEMIVVLFDVNRLGSTVPMIMKLLEPFKEKVKIILNKSDTIPPDNILKVRENLLWQLAKVVNTHDVIKVYYGSYWNYEYDETFMTTLMKQDQIQFEKDINEFAKHYKNTRIGQIQKRAKKLRFYYHLHAQFLKRHFRIKHKKQWAKRMTPDEYFKICKLLVDAQIITEANIPPVEEWIDGVKKLNDIKAWKPVDKNLDFQLEEFINKDLNSIILCANQEKPPEWNLMLNRIRIRKHHYDSLDKNNLKSPSGKEGKFSKQNSNKKIIKKSNNSKNNLVSPLNNFKQTQHHTGDIKFSTMTTPYKQKESLSSNSKQTTIKREVNNITKAHEDPNCKTSATGYEVLGNAINQQ